MQTLTVFDLDETLIHGDTPNIWRHYLQDINVITDSNFAKKNQEYLQQYAAGTLNFSDFLAFSLSPIANTPIAQVEEWLQDCIQKRIITKIYPQATALIKALTQKNNGEDILIISATVSFIVKAIAAELGIKNAIGVDLKIENDAYTHHIVGTPSFQSGKVVRLKQWLKQQEKDYDNIDFYTDSINDLPLCEFADQVFTVNPCKQLRPIAEARNWHILDWAL